MNSINFNLLLRPINLYRILLLFGFFIVAIKSKYILDFYTFFQIFIGVPIVVFILTYKNFWFKRIVNKNKYERTIEEIVFEKNKKGLKYYFNISLFYIVNFIVISLLFMSLFMSGMEIK